MEFILNNKKNLFILGTGLLLVIFLFVVALSIFFPSSPPPTDTISQPASQPNAPIPNVSSTEFYDPYNEEYKQSVEQIQKEEKTIHDRNVTVGRFIDTLPYTGTAMSIRYDIRTNSVTVTISSGKRLEGENELSTYLQSQGITDRSWIQNLSILYQ